MSYTDSEESKWVITKANEITSAITFFSSAYFSNLNSRSWVFENIAFSIAFAIELSFLLFASASNDS